MSFARVRNVMGHGCYDEDADSGFLQVDFPGSQTFVRTSHQTTLL